jgi:hypothetical protein
VLVGEAALGGVSTRGCPRCLSTNTNVTLTKGGAPGFLCRLLKFIFIANNYGAKKPGASMCRYFENRGGVYAA